MYERFQKEKSKLEEMNDQIARELNGQLAMEVEKNKKTYQNVDQILENYKNSIVSL